MNKEAIEYYNNVYPQIKNFCSPLKDYLGISLFIYFRIYYDSSYVIFTNDLQTTIDYCTKINNDKMHSYFKSYLEKEIVGASILWPNTIPTTEGMNIFFEKGHWHGITLPVFNENYIECCSFLGEVNNPNISDFFLRYGCILEKFSSHFKAKLSKIIEEGLLYKAKYNNGYNFYLPDYKLNKLPDVKGFLDAVGISPESLIINGNVINFTEREKQCLELMSQGHSIKGIGRKLSLSPRTIESHIYNVKQKTGYHYKYDLIQIYQEILNTNETKYHIT